MDDPLPSRNLPLPLRPEDGSEPSRFPNLSHSGEWAYGGMHAPPPNDADAEPAAIDIRDVIGAVRRRLWTVAALVAVVVGIAGIYFWRQPPVFSAKAAVRFVDERKQLTGGIDGDVGKLMGQSTDPILSQIQVLRSRGVSELVVSNEPLGTRLVTTDFPLAVLTNVRVDRSSGADSIRIRFMPEGVTASGLGTTREGAYGVPLVFRGIEFTVASRPSDTDRGTLHVREFDAAVASLQRHLDARPRKGTDVIDVEFTASDPQVAQAAANAVVRTFQEFSASGAQELSSRRREFIEGQLRQTDSMLLEAQQALTQFRTSRRVYGSTQQIAEGQTALMQLDMRRGELDADRNVARRLLEAIGRSRQGGNAEALRTLVSSPGIAANAVVAQLYGELVEYGRLRDSLTSGVNAAASTNPDVVRINALIAQTEERLVGAVRSHVASLDARIEALDMLRSRSAAGLQTLPQTEAEEERLRQRVTTTLLASEQLRQEYQKARIAEAVQIGQVQILDLAGLPAKPVGTPLQVKLGLAAMVGLFLAVGLVLFLEQMNTSIRTREDIEKYLQAPALAIIPRIDRFSEAKGVRRLLGGRRELHGGAVAVAAAAPVGRAANLLIDIDAGAHGGEAYRTLRTNLIYSRTSTGLRTLVVTSAAPGDGKTTTASNLAVAFAHQGLRVLLVDCDLRRATVHEVFSVAKEPGLTQALVGICPIPECVKTTPVELLSVLPAGATPPNPSELIGSAGMKELIGQLSATYDLVIYDSPPVLAAADAAILGRLMDGVLLVTRAGTTDRGAATTAVRQLRSVGARVLGVVLNDPDAKVPSYSAEYGYYYSYESQGATA